MDRFARIVRLHRILDGRRTPISTGELAARLECSERTVYRALDTLRDELDAPVECVREQGYRYDTADGRRVELPGLWFSADEIQALLILHRHLEALEPGLLSEQLAPVRGRLERLLENRHAGLAGLLDRVRFISIGQRRTLPERFSEAAEALLQRRAVAITYHGRSSDAVTDRTVDPQRLVHYRDTWYLDAWCRLRRDLRTFSIDRIRHLEPTGETAGEVPAAHLDAHYASAYGIFAGEPTDVALLCFTPKGARWAAAVQWHPQQEERWLDGGRYELRIPFGRSEELIRDVLAYGPEVEVMAPEVLRQAVAGRIRDMAARYTSTDTD